MSKRVLAVCIKTYVDEDDMVEYCEGIRKPCEVKVYVRGSEHLVYEKYVNKEYYKVI